MRQLFHFILFVTFSLSLIGCNNPSTPTPTDVIASITEAAPTLTAPTEAAPTEAVPTDTTVPAPPQPELVTETTGFPVPADVANLYEAIIRYDPETVMLHDKSSVFMTFPNELHEDRLDLFFYDRNGTQHIPLKFNDKTYHVVGNMHEENWKWLVFDCVSFLPGGDYDEVTTCAINTGDFDQFLVMPMPTQGFDHPATYDFGFDSLTTVLVAVTELYNNVNSDDQIFRWNLDSNTIEQLSFAPVTHWGIEVSRSESYAATESYTGDWSADQFIQTYDTLGENWRYRGAVLQGYALGWAEDKLVYMTYDANCHPKGCSKLHTFDPNTQQDDFLLVLPSNAFWYNQMHLSPSEDFAVLFADSGMQGIYSCYLSLGGFCSQIVEPLNGQPYQVFGFMSEDLLLMKVGDTFRLIPASPEKG